MNIHVVCGYVCRHSRSPGDRGLPISENVFAAIDPTCQRELCSSSSGCTNTTAVSQSTVQPVPTDIHAARSRAPLGSFLCFLYFFVILYFAYCHCHFWQEKHFLKFLEHLVKYIIPLQVSYSFESQHI